MYSSFTYTVNPARIVFGSGRISDVETELRNQGCSRALVLSTPNQEKEAHDLAQQLGSLCVGVFTEAAMHTPVSVTERALAVYAEKNADSVVAFGGGSTTGLGKAIAYRNQTIQVVLPTTYAGSEVTPILGQTEDGRKTTVRHASILPEVVIYDPDLSRHLPVDISITSGLNAMAHAIEGLYAADANPVSSSMAVQGVQRMQSALKIIVNDPDNLEARGDALIGAWLCGTVLGTVGMALHHKICHTLGGSFDLPHAPTHAIMLPHSTAYNEQAAAQQLQPLQAIFGQQSVGAGLYQFAQSIGAPLALKDIGLHEAQLDRAAELAAQNPYHNPRPIEKEAIRRMLQRAWEGLPPEVV